MLVSIIMGTNCKGENLHLLKRAVNSILEQTFKNFEFIICENESDDFVNEYLDSLKDNRIRIIHSIKHKSLSQKLNCCIALSEGEIIARMDDDDYSHPDRIKEQVYFLEKNTEIGFVGCNVNYFDESGFIYYRKFPEFPQIEDFRLNLPYTHPSICFRKDTLLLVNGYDESSWSNGCEDYDIILRLYEQGIFGHNIQKDLLNYNIRNNFNSKISLKFRFNETIIRFVRFRSLGMLPRYFIYVIKPLIVGLIPFKVLRYLKIKRLI